MRGEVNHSLTPRARSVVRRLAVLVANDDLVTVDEVADALNIDRRNARKWLRKLESLEVISCRRVEVARVGGRPIILNRVTVFPTAARESEGHLGEGAPPSPIFGSSFSLRANGDQMEKKDRGGRCAELAPEFDELFASKIEDVDTLPKQSPLAGWLREMLPPFPDCDQVSRPARTPPQPTFGHEPAANINLMIRAYRCVHKHRLPGRRCTVDKTARYRLRKVLAAFRRNGITQPYAWAMFRFRMWEIGRAAENKKSSRPGIDKIFAAPIVDDHAAWFLERADAYAKPRSRLAPAHLRLVRLWNQARDELVCRRPQTRLEAQDVVSEIVGPDVYAELRDVAVREVEAMEARARARLSNNEWIWGLTA